MVTILSRRSLIAGSLTLGFSAAAASNRRHDIRRFQTADFDIEIAIDYHDGYTSSGLAFRDQISRIEFCRSAKGIQSRGCSPQFRGSVAIAQYTVKARSPSVSPVALREHVRTIDHDARLRDRPPFERTIELQKGAGSDIQAFGYEPSRGDHSIANDRSAWYLFRQDIFLEPQQQMVFTIYWKHTLQRIRMLDLIPGKQTWPVIG
jgi:hypothetical protein